jgi:hypothetical protein
MAKRQKSNNQMIQKVKLHPLRKKTITKYVHNLRADLHLKQRAQAGRVSVYVILT